jgi:hypothetical protein
VVTPICHMCRRPEYSDGECPVAKNCAEHPQLNLGCGISPFAEFVNFDARICHGIQGWDKHLQTDVVGLIQDITKIFPHDYFEVTQSAHVIEHFEREGSIQFLKDQYVLLKRGGKIVVEGPCMLGAIRWFQEGPEGYGRGDVNWLLNWIYPWKHAYEEEWNEFMRHRSGWTGPVLADVLSGLGFNPVFVGEGRLHGCGWRDFRVEAIKL